MVGYIPDHGGGLSLITVGGLSLITVGGLSLITVGGLSLITVGGSSSRFIFNFITYIHLHYIDNITDTL